MFEVHLGYGLAQSVHYDYFNLSRNMSDDIAEKTSLRQRPSVNVSFTMGRALLPPASIQEGQGKRPNVKTPKSRSRVGCGCEVTNRMYSSYDYLNL
jgi:hypothetical protein